MRVRVRLRLSGGVSRGGMGIGLKRREESYEDPGGER